MCVCLTIYDISLDNHIWFMQSLFVWPIKKNNYMFLFASLGCLASLEDHLLWMSYRYLFVSICKRYPKKENRFLKRTAAWKSANAGRGLVAESVGSAQFWPPQGHWRKTWAWSSRWFGWLRYFPINHHSLWWVRPFHLLVLSESEKDDLFSNLWHDQA